MAGHVALIRLAQSHQSFDNVRVFVRSIRPLTSVLGKIHQERIFLGRKASRTGVVVRIP
jgi:hypothetical protein